MLSTTQPAVKQPLPSGPTTLCFYKDDFMKHDFNVEHFLVECRRKVPLETLRDDLNTYLKILRSAMIELINKDYADFVNLSTNLVGLDKAINNLTVPLDQLKSEVLAVQGVMDMVAGSVENQMKMQADVREEKICLERLMNIIRSVEKIEKLLGLRHDDTSSPEYTEASELSGQLIERVATEFNKLQFYVNKSRGLTLVEQIKPRIASITSTLQFSLEGAFRAGLQSGNVEVLRQCLRTYSTIDKMRDAEQLFRLHVVRPHLQQIITEQFMNDHPLGLQGLYTAILDFIRKECKKLKGVTMSANEVVRGYDFLVFAVWPEIVNDIEAMIPTIFAPGNPDVFHEKYSVSMEFVERFERHCVSQESVRRLRAEPSYVAFTARWSLPVYFQIRFQEIAGAFETSLATPFNNAESGSTFQLHCTHTLWGCLQRCWQQGVYLTTLCHRFWKLTLQLLARYATFLVQATETEMSGKVVGVSEESDVGVSERSSDRLSSAQATPPLTITQLVRLIADANSVIEKLSVFYEELIQPQMKQISNQNTILLQESLAECQQSIGEHLPEMSDFVTADVISQCSVTLKLVNDIPRLYRRTNREMPTKASSYVLSLLRPLHQFVDDHKDVMPEDQRRKWTTDILQSLAQQYLAITSDVLTSVRKMEESLRRLKKAKSSAQPAGSSDDDKIRMQFKLDVQLFGQQIEIMGISKDSIEAFVRLDELVTTARNSAQPSA